ncbi:MAG: DUF1385 domain-containing protein [Candidatus Dormiibacterota bacterium]
MSISPHTGAVAAPASRPATPFFYGGQAVIEGVLMRGPTGWAVAARRPDGQIALRKDKLKSVVYRGRFFRLPFIRGVVGLVEMLHLGTSAMMWSANVKAKADDIEIGRGAIIITIIASLCFSGLIFFGLPLLAGGALQRRGGSLAFTAVEGVTRALLLIAYLWLISFIPDIRRLFQYHGAEHKTINAFEAGEPLTTDDVGAQSRLHPRCGTGFLVVVVAVSIVVFTFVGRPSLPLLIASRILLIPVIAGISYEIIKLGARHSANPVVKRLLWPVLAAQYLTTREPDASQMEVAITAFTNVREDERVEQEMLR